MFAKIALVISWLPRVVAVAMLVEDLLDEAVPGTEKKEAALTFLQRQGLPNQYVAVIESLIDLVVDVLHATGVFKRRKNEVQDVTVDASLLRDEVVAVVNEDSLGAAYERLLKK